MYGVNGVPYMSPADYNRYMSGMYNNTSAYNQNAVNSMAATQQRNLAMQQMLNGRPVSSMEEAKASMIELDGSLFVFPDIANRKIYTKQILMDGSADFKTYVLTEEPKRETKQENGDFVLRKDFEESVSVLVDKIKELEGKLYEQCNGNDGKKFSTKKPTFSESNADG